VLNAARDARLLGVEKDTDQRYAGERSWEFDVRHQGWRYHMSNLMAAIGLEQLKRFPELARTRQALASHYDRCFARVPGVQPLCHDYATVVPHIYVVRIAGLRDRQTLRQALLDRGIQTGVHYQPNHWLTRFRDATAAPLPVTDAVYPELLTLPLHPDVTPQQVEYVSAALGSLLV
jgi:dTDP-4-amino-4,6-dideoxygalactose transaminase